MKRLPVRIAIAMTVSAIVVASVKFATVTFGQAPAETAHSAASAIEAPDHWVAFTADAARTEVGGSTVVGRFMRTADGSSRFETGPSLSDVRSIDIKNVPRQRLYLYLKTSKGEGWIERPMKIIGEFRPKKLRAGVMPFARAIDFEQFDAFQYNGKSGEIVTLIPALNYFAADTIGPWSRARFSNFQTGVQLDPVLFEPPPGANPIYKDEYAGIVMYTAEEAEALRSSR